VRNHNRIDKQSKPALATLLGSIFGCEYRSLVENDDKGELCTRYGYSDHHLIVLEGTFG
jgi:hypothetical protein